MAMTDDTDTNNGLPESQAQLLEDLEAAVCTTLDWGWMIVNIWLAALNLYRLYLHESETAATSTSNPSRSYYQVCPCGDDRPAAADYCPWCGREVGDE